MKLFWSVNISGCEDLPVDGFHKSRGSSYVNRNGFAVKLVYDKCGGTMSHSIIANR